MATGMKIWTGLVVVSVALLSISWVPPEVLPNRLAIPPSHEEARAGALRSDINRANDVLKRIRWARELEAYLAENAMDGLAIRGAGTMTAEALATHRVAVQERLDRLPARDPEALLGVFWVPLESGSHPDVPPSTLEAGTEYYVGDLDGRPYCFSVRAEVERNLSDRDLIDPGRRSEWSRGSGVGVCRYVVAYGAPGDRILAWLEEGATAFGNSERHADRTYDDWGWLGRGPFGISYSSTVNQKLGLDRCLGGIEAACVELVLHPTPMRPQPRDERRLIAESPVTSVYRMTGLLEAGSMLFHDIETDFGAEAFDHFWSSDLDVPASFEAAFGVGMEEWLVGWMDDQFSGFRPGPGLTRSARFGGLLAITLFGLIAGFWNRRRKVA